MAVQKAAKAKNCGKRQKRNNAESGKAAESVKAAGSEKLRKAAKPRKAENCRKCGSHGQNRKMAEGRLVREPPRIKN